MNQFEMAREIVRTGQITDEVSDIDFPDVIDALRVRLTESLSELEDAEDEEESENQLRATIENLQVEAFIAGFLTAPQSMQNPLEIGISAEQATELVRHLLANGGLDVRLTIG